jgi:Flp pilus assembly protein TadG
MRRLSCAARRRLARLVSDRSSDRRSDEGAIAIIAAVLFGLGVVLAMAALTVDVGTIYGERRQLQNGADAAALAVAQDAATLCSTGPCVPSSRAQTYANANSGDGTSAVLEICGAGWAAIPGCTAQSTPAITKCPAVPGGVTSWVRVRTATLTTGGSTLLPPWFAQTLAGNGGYAGERVFACAQAGLGAPSSLTATLPLTLSLCEWNAYTSTGSNFAPPPPYPPYPLSYEHAIYFHDTTGAAHCNAGPSGADLPGGFGWLATGSGTCSAAIDDQSWVNDNTGNSIPMNCRSILPTLVGTTVFLPVFDNANGLTGANGSYHVSGFAAFYLTGYSFPSDRVTSVASGIRFCNSSQSCLYGWFTQALAPTGGSGGGTPRGTSVVQLIG